MIHVAMKKKLRILGAVLILAATLVAFVHYTRTHPAVLQKLSDTHPLLLLVLVACYGIWFLALALILRISLRLYQKTMPPGENIMLNAYSSLVNFFGPGQSGPAIRGLYLKKRHDLKIKHYIFATLIYYGFYAVLSAFLLFVGNQTWWQTMLLMAAAGLGGYVIIRWYAARSQIRNNPGMTAANLVWLLIATAAQIVMQVIIYFIELKSISPGITFAQTLTYTGAANFSLFVSLTPGAIGIREAFLVFSQGLHHISNTVIVAANVIDRAAYLLLLGVLFVMVLALHAKDRLRIHQIAEDASEKNRNS